MDRSNPTTGQLVERHAGYLRRLARALVGDDAAAQDVVQETWRVALEEPDRGAEQPRSWLAGIARRIAWRRLRDDERRVGRERDTARPEASGTSGAPESLESSDALDLVDTVQAAMRRLDEPFREAIVQRYLHDLTPREIARRTGVPVGTVKSRLKRGLAALRDDLDGQHGGVRRTWALAFAVGFELPAPVPIATPVSANPPPASPHGASHAAGHTAGYGALWTAIVSMNIKILAAATVVVSFSLWALRKDGSVEQTAPRMETASRDTALVLPEVLLGDASETQERGALGTDPATTVVAAVAMHTFVMDFTVRDELGDAFANVAVQIAPPDHSFVTVGTTDASGHLHVTWDARVEMMTVDVALVAGASGLIGVQRLDVHSGQTRSVEAQVPRPTPWKLQVRVTSLKTHLVELELELAHSQRRVGVRALVEDATPGRRWPRRGEAGHDEGDRITFGNDRDSRAAVRDLIDGGSMRLDQGTIQFSATDDHAKSVAPQVQKAVVEGIVVDGLGRPAIGYPVRFVVPGKQDRVDHVLTDADGRFRIKSPPGRIRCFVGNGARTVKWERELAPGEVAGWNPAIDRSRDLLLHVSSSDGNDMDGTIVQARHDDGRRLWIGRAILDKSHNAMILDCPSQTVDVDLMAPAKVAAVPLASAPGVPTGDVWELMIDMESLFPLKIQYTPDDSDRPLRSASELLVFNQSRTWGTRVPVLGEVGSPASVTLPGGTWWLELATRETGRTEIGTVHVVGDQPIDLGLIALEPLGELVVPAALEPGATVEVHHVRGDIDSLVARSSAERPQIEPLQVRPGLYRVTTVSADGGRSAKTIDVRAGESVSTAR